MPGRSDIFRAAAILALIACVIATFIAIGRHPAAPVVETFPVLAAPTPDDLSAELRRCGALGPQDAEDARCVAVWEENRQRFFGRPARPLPPPMLPGAAAPVPAPSGDAR